MSSIIKHFQLEAESILNEMPFEEGSLYFTEDTKRIFLDPVAGNSRILINGDPIILSTESERENLLAPIPGKIYFILETSNIYIYQNSIWHSYVETDATLTISGKAADAKAVGDAISKYATCSTEAATTAKVVSLSNYTLVTGGIIAVKFTYAVPASATMNINSKGAKAIYYNGVEISNGIINAGDTATFIYDGTNYHLLAIDTNILNETQLAGIIYLNPSDTLPDGFLWCDGSAISRTDYAELFAVIGTIYGTGDGSTTFNLPDLSSRVPVGASSEYELGSTGGDENDSIIMINMNDTTNEFSTNTHLYTVVNYIISTGKGPSVGVNEIVKGIQTMPLGIEYGGTGSTNAAAALSALGGVNSTYVTNTIAENIDTTLTLSGKAADSYIVGALITKLNETISNLESNKAEVEIYKGTFSAGSWSTSTPYTQTLTISGLLVDDYPDVDIDLSSASDPVSIIEGWDYIGRVAIHQNNTVTAYCYIETPDVDIPVILRVVR